MSSIRITDASLGHMSQIFANNNISTEKLLDITEKLDRVGLYSIELCEGSSFEVSLRQLKEDPWERIKKIKSKINNTKIQILLRGNRLNGNDCFSDDIVKYFIEKVAANGVDIVRVSDPLNDIRNLETVIEACINEGISAQGTLYYTESPVHSLEYFKAIAKQIEEMKVDSICIKDVQGLLGPFEAYELIAALKKQNTIPIHLHIPIANETALTTYVKAIEAGVDGIDSSASIINPGMAHSPLELLADVLKGTEYDIKLNRKLLGEISCYYHSLTHKYAADHKVFSLRDTSKHITKGMLSNLIYILKQLDKEQYMEEAISEIQRVRMDLGYPPLAVPVSQIIVVQAVLNLVAGERYKMVTERFKGLINGEFGKLPVSIKRNIKKTILEGERDKRKNMNVPNMPSLETVKEQVAKDIQKDEDILTYLMFPHHVKEILRCQQEQSAAYQEAGAAAEAMISEALDKLGEHSAIGSEKNIYEAIMMENSSPNILYIDG